MIVTAEQVGKQVEVASGTLTILQEVSFAVAAGESLAIIGVSGSGKSTLLGLLAGLDLPSSGRITLAGEELNALDEDGRARLRGQKVGFVFQTFQLLPGLTALENVMLPLELAGNAAAEAQATGLLERVGLDQRLEHYPKQLSGGEQQRVAIARALVNDPQVVIADEPTANLDTALSREFMAILETLKAQGKTILLTSHDPLVTESAVVDTVIDLRDGRLVK